MDTTAGAPQSAPSKGKKAAGILLTALIFLGFPDMAREVGSTGIGWAIAGLVAGLFLLVAAIRNWPILWNPLGRLFRKLLGERGARMSLGFLGLAFALLSANAIINPEIPDCLGPQIAADPPTFIC